MISRTFQKYEQGRYIPRVVESVPSYLDAIEKRMKKYERTLDRISRVVNANSVLLELILKGVYRNG